MTRRTPASYKKRSPTHGAKVIAHLEQLRADDCLGMHSLEDAEAGQLYPPRTITYLENNDKAPLAKLLCRHNQVALHSLSLLPHGDKSIIPFTEFAVAYLFDLSVEHKDAPALVVRAFPRNGGTGDNRFHKELWLGTNYGVADLDGLYRGHTEASFKAAVAADPSLSTAQLKALAATYDHPDTPLKSDHNEILAAVRKDHIAAIAISRNKRSEVPDAFYELKGALAGLAHVQHGIDRPVVIYHFNEDDPTLNGKCTYVAQGKEECEAKAIEAIATLQRDDKPAMLNCFRNSCRELLGVAVEKPIEGQVAAQIKRG